MTTILSIRYRQSGSSIEKEHQLTCDLNIGVLAKALAVRLELQDEERYQLVLERNDQLLKRLDHRSTLADAGIQNHDKLVFILHEETTDSLLLDEEAQFLVPYTLTLTADAISPYVQHSIYLNRRCENDPQRHYFSDPIINGRLKFERFLEDKAGIGKIRADVIERLIELWCGDIEQGFPTTTLPLNIRI
jgi:hypothetical protein